MEIGLVCRFMLCRSQSLTELERVLHELSEEHSIVEISSDNCCHDRLILQHIFGEKIIGLALKKGVGSLHFESNGTFTIF